MKIAMFGIKGVPVPAGAEKVAEQIGSRLVQRGHQVRLYVRPHYTPRTLKEYKGMRLVHLPSIPTKNLDAITHSLFSTFAVMISEADIVHIHSTGNSVFAFLPRLCGKKTVVQSHGLDWQRAKWGRFAKLYLRITDYSTVHFPSATTAVSRKLTNYYQNFSRRRVVYIPNGVTMVDRAAPHLIHRYGLQANEYLLFAARLVPEKGAHYLLEAFKRLRTDKKLVVAGGGAYGDKYAEQLLSHASEKIIFPGFVEGALFQELLSNAYAYILPSEVEGLSTGLLEAMSYGNCVIVSDIEENLEAIGDAGLTFCNQSIDDLTLKLEQIIRDAELARAYGLRAQEYVRNHYSWETVTDQMEELYMSLG